MIETNRSPLSLLSKAVTVAADSNSRPKHLAAEKKDTSERLRRASQLAALAAAYSHHRRRT
jgi:hypothetical protein